MYRSSGINCFRGGRMSELVKIRNFNQRYEAEIARGLLEEGGIESIISADDCGGQLMGLLSLRMGGVKLLISEEDVVKAEEILEVLGEENKGS
jgi:hypothetical protein